MKYAGIIKNDTANGCNGLSLSFFTQGCPHHCPGCFNPETWDFNGGYEFTPQTLSSILQGLNENGIKRNFCILGGEPLCKENLILTQLLVTLVRQTHPNNPIYIWTGYTIEELLNRRCPSTLDILKNIDYLIDGPFKQELKDISLTMRGSSNQRIWSKDQIQELLKLNIYSKINKNKESES